MSLSTGEWVGLAILILIVVAIAIACGCRSSACRKSGSKKRSRRRHTSDSSSSSTASTAKSLTKCKPKPCAIALPPPCPPKCPPPCPPPPCPPPPCPPPCLPVCIPVCDPVAELTRRLNELEHYVCEQQKQIKALQCTVKTLEHDFCTLTRYISRFDFTCNLGRAFYLDVTGQIVVTVVLPEFPSTVLLSASRNMGFVEGTGTMLTPIGLRLLRSGYYLVSFNVTLGNLTDNIIRLVVILAINGVADITAEQAIAGAEEISPNGGELSLSITVPVHLQGVNELSIRAGYINTVVPPPPSVLVQTWSISAMQIPCMCKCCVGGGDLHLLK